MTKTEQPFVSRQRIYFDMRDALGMLHNAAFLVLFERARFEFWAALGVAPGDPGLDWPYFVARNEVNYRTAIWTDQEITVTVAVTSIGRTSLTLRHEIYDAAGVLSADGQSVLVRVNAETKRPEPWSEGFRALVAPHLRAS